MEVALPSVRFLSVMAAREFDDWSPTSVFGPSVPTPRHEKTPQELPGRQQSSSLEDNNSPPEEPAWEDEDYAARVIQARLRVWLLYKREAESIVQVNQLRLELENAAAAAIVDWLRRCLVRYGLLERAASMRYQRSIRRDARKCIYEWVQEQRDVSRFRGMLRRRALARRKISCWLRRIQCEVRCMRRRKLREEDLRQAREHAQQLILRVVWASIKRQRRAIRRQASAYIGRFVVASALRRRAKAEAEAERRRRLCAGSLKIRQALSEWDLRLRLLHWRVAVQHQRQAEIARHHHAACVLQRLIRVMLTAFRLMRRRDAASKIQSIIRGGQARTRYRNRLRERLCAAAVIIQRRVRGFLARRRVNRLLEQLRERFKCLNCGLIEPGGLYCKFCGRRRTTFDVLGPGIAAGLTTTDAKLRKKRKSKPSAEVSDAETTLSLPPAAPLPFVKHSQGQRQAHALALHANVLTMALPDVMPPSPAKTSNSGSLPSVLVSPRFTSTQLCASPVQRPSYPRKPPGAGQTGVRPSHFHRSVSVTESSSRPVAGLVSVDKTRQRAEALMQHDNSRFQQHAQSTMNLHLQRLQKGGKAASR